MPFRSPVSDIRFVLEKVVGFAEVQATEAFSEASSDVTDAILDGGAKLCDDVLAPLNRAGDLHPAVLENGVVRTSPGFRDGFRAMAEGGHGGQDLHLPGQVHEGGVGSECNGKKTELDLQHLFALIFF